MNIQPIITEETYNAPAGKVWNALTDKEQMKQWYFDIPDFKAENGAEFSWYEPGENRKFLHKAQITKIEPNKLLQHSWYYPELSRGKSTVSWELEPQGDQTRLRLTHEGLENFSDGGPDLDRKNFEAGWQDILGRSLREFVEK